MLLIAMVFTVFPKERNWPFVVAAGCLGLLLMLIGSGKIYRPAITRAGDTIICSYNPWREATFYLALLGMPLIGCMIIVGGPLLSIGSPGLWRIVGVVIIAATLIPISVFMRHHRRNLLSINPVALSVQLLDRPEGLTEMTRDSVQSVTSSTGRLGNGDTAPTTQITFQDAASTVPQTVVIGPTNVKKTAWLTVEQADLVAGLEEWRSGDPGDTGLMDRVEVALRGRLTTSARGH